MRLKRLGLAVLCGMVLFGIHFLTVPAANAQFRNSFNSGYNNNNYNRNYNSNSGYNNNYNNNNYNNYNNRSFGSSRMGSSQFGGGFGGSSFNQGGMGGGLSSRGQSSFGRSGRSSRYNSGYNNNNYNQQGNSRYNSGYNTGYNNSSSSRSRGRGYQSDGNVPQSGQSQQNIQPGQTQSKGVSSDRRGALKGNVSGPLGKGGSGPAGSEGGIMVQGGGSSTRSASGKGGPAASAARSSKKSGVPMRQSAIMYLYTRNTMVLVNEPFPVDVILTNPQKNEFNEVSFVLKYDPQVLMPVAGKDELDQWIPASELMHAMETEPSHDKPGNVQSQPKTTAETPTNEAENASVEETEDTLSSEPKQPSPFLFEKMSEVVDEVESHVDSINGVITLTAELKKGEVIKESGLLGRITFLPMVEANQSIIDFVFQGEGAEEENSLTRLTDGSKDLLGSSFDPQDGVIDLEVEVVSSMDRGERSPRVKKAGERDFDSDTDAGDYETHFYLLPRQESVEVGDTVEVDIYLENKNGVQIDAVSLLIAYNPRYLEAVDGDDFAPGVNLYDKEYKDTFPFDFPKVNSIDTERGIIDYRKMGYKVPIRGEGVLATARFRTLRPTTKTTLRVFLNESGEDPTTGIFYRYKDRLGDPTNPFDGVTTASLSVRATAAYLEKIQPVSN